MEKSIKNRNARVAFYIYFLSMTALKSLGLSSNDKAFMIVFMIALAFLALKIIYTEYRPSELIVVFSLVLLSLIGFLRAREQTYFLAAISIAGMKGINFKDLCRKTFWVHSVFSFLAVTGSMLGYFQDNLLIINEETKAAYHTYGYSDFNVLFVNMFIIAALLIYIRYEKLGIWEFVLTNLLMLWTYHATHSRTGYILFFGMWLLIILDKFLLKEHWKKKLYKIYTFAPFIMVFLSFLLPYLYELFGKTKIMYEINHVLTGRVFIMNYYLKLYPFTLFGNTYEFWLHNAGKILEIVDNLYVTIYLYSGVVMLILYVVGVFALLQKLYRKRYDIELILVAILAVYAFMEEFPLNPTVNPFAVMLAWIIFDGNMIRGDDFETGRNNNQHSVSLPG
ncbi:MAG: hypothetical protein NC086_00800 [Alistipes sp.]|nr:hypothetical protein [Alistipes sp.]